MLDLANSAVYKMKLLVKALCISSAVQLQMASIRSLSWNYSFHDVKTDVIYAGACVDDIVPALSETACDRDVCNTLASC